MKSILSASATLVLVVGVIVPVFGAEITGELVDQTCYAKDKANSVGVGHEECAMTCAMKGQTVAVVTDKGEVFAIAGELAKDNNAVLVPHMSHRVVVTGEIVEKDGAKTITAVAVKMAGPKS
jgi:hypothetical protein